MPPVVGQKRAQGRREKAAGGAAAYREFVVIAVGAEGAAGFAAPFAAAAIGLVAEIAE